VEPRDGAGDDELGSQDCITVRSIHAGPNARAFTAVSHVSLMKGASFGLARLRPSAQNFPISATSAASPSALAQSTRRKLSLLHLAQELQNVTKACRSMGYHRDTF